MNNLLNLFKQPSTWAGVSILLSSFGVYVAPEAVASIGGGIAAVLAIVLPEQGAK